MDRLREQSSSASQAKPCGLSWRGDLTAALLLTLLLAIVLGCGRKNLPRPPELVAPEVIKDLQGSNAKDGILLTWKRPARYADGSRMLDLGGFEIERSTAGGPFAPLTAVQVTDSDRFRQIRNFRYVDSAVSDNEVYRYRIVSFTTDRYFSLPSNTVEIVRSTPAVGSDS
jgi:hypothetical protein